MHQSSTSSPALRVQPTRSQPLLSPLRYPGGKRRLVPFIAETLKLNGFHPLLFVEPFAGGASVAFQLLSDGVVERIGLIDRDPLVAAFWNTVLSDAEWLVKQVETLEVTLAQWEAFKQTTPQSRRQKALTCLFLNRTSFSGIMAPGAGPIGGYDQASEYNIDCRFPRKTLIKRIQHIHALRDRVAFVWNITWASGMSRIKGMQQRGTLPPDVFYYCDPPFFNEAHRLYTYYFRTRDHRNLRDALLAETAPWILSYDSVDEVERLYGEGCSPSHIDVLYSAGKYAGSRMAKEAVVTNLATLPSNFALWTRSNTPKNDPDVSRSA